jgi:hypothetical protein
MGMERRVGEGGREGGARHGGRAKAHTRTSHSHAIGQGVRVAVVGGQGSVDAVDLSVFVCWDECVKMGADGKKKKLPSVFHVTRPCEGVQPRSPSRQMHAQAPYTPARCSVGRWAGRTAPQPPIHHAAKLAWARSSIASHSRFTAPPASLWVPGPTAAAGRRWQARHVQHALTCDRASSTAAVKALRASIHTMWGRQRRASV